ncbi:lipoprotein-releasing system permease protein [Spirosomataceae bacterium TFI 002]|nr:lipoprotein-releasing system permease protein [Spirosomataceae bacterium TFI 002]
MNLEQLLAKKIRITKGQAFSSTVLKVGVISVALGVAVVLISFAVLLGFKETIKEKLFTVSSHLQISKITLNQSYEEAPFVFNSEIQGILKNNTNIARFDPIIQKSAILKSEKEINGVLLKGVADSFDWKAFNVNMVAGRAIELDSSYSKEIVLSQTQLKLLNVKLGDEILIYFIQNPPRARKLKIVGVYNTGIPELDESFALVDIQLLRRINNWEENEIGHVEVFLNDFKKLDQSASKLYESLPQDLLIKPITRFLPQFFDWFNLLDRNIIIVIILIVAVAGFNMISVLLIMIMERTPMVGLLKSLGTSNASIQKIFTINAFNIIFKGLLIGNLIAMGVCLIQYYFKIIPLEEESYYMSAMPIQWDWMIFLFVNVGITLFVGLIAYLPTISIRKISPVKVLKYKD